jgi:hypothetical protein
MPESLEQSIKKMEDSRNNSRYINGEEFFSEKRNPDSS